jgi:hypothetical protein
MDLLSTIQGWSVWFWAAESQDMTWGEDGCLLGFSAVCFGKCWILFNNLRGLSSAEVMLNAEGKILRTIISRLVEMLHQLVVLSKYSVWKSLCYCYFHSAKDVPNGSCLFLKLWRHRKCCGSLLKGDNVPISQVRTSITFVFSFFYYQRSTR